MTSLVQGVFDVTGNIDLKSSFAIVSASRKRQAALEAEMKKHPEWTLAAGGFKRHPGWTLDKEIDSALVTSIFRLRRKGALDRAFQRTFPDDLKAYYSRYTVAKRPGRLKVYDRGVYYAGETRTHRFEPLQVTKHAGGVFMTNNGRNPVIAEGRTAGDYELHWAALGWSRRKMRVRKLLRIDVELKGLSGEFAVQARNNWVTQPGDGLPIRINHSFTGREETARKSAVVEPVKPESPWFYRNSSGKLIVTWQPNADDSSIECSVKVTEIDLHAEIERSGPPLPM
jgi:hypothetical protein